MKTRKTNIKENYNYVHNFVPFVDLASIKLGCFFKVLLPKRVVLFNVVIENIIPFLGGGKVEVV